MDTEQNDRVQEWMLILGDWVRETPRSWFIAAVSVLVAAIPLYMTFSLVLEQVFIRSNDKLQVVYTPSIKKPLEITDTKIFDYGDGTYAGYARVKNQEYEWGVPEQQYTVVFRTFGGLEIKSISDNTYILPASEKIIVFPRFSNSTKPDEIKLTLGETRFVRPPDLPNLNLEIQRRTMDLQASQTIVNAVVLNHSPFNITRVDLPILLYDNANKVVGVNYTNINDLKSAESRSFQYTWYSRLNNVARQEIVPEINIFNKDIFLALPDINPF